MILEISDKWVRVDRIGGYKDGIYFVIYNDDQQYELWSTGEQGTHLLRTSPWLYEVQGKDGRIYFAESVANVNSLWSSDGSLAGTAKVAEFGNGFLNALTPFNGKLFFSVNDTIYAADGIDGTTTALRKGQLQASGVLKGTFYAMANSGPGNILISSDGSVAGTQTVSMLGDGYLPLYGTLPVINNKLLLGMTSYSAGAEPAVSDGTEQGTALLKDINPGMPGANSMSFSNLTDNLSVFLADDGQHGNAVWMTDGTSTGTKLLLDPAPGTESSTGIYELRLLNDKILFQADADPGPLNLWSSDGTESGTVEAYDFQSFASFFATTNDAYWSFDNGRLLKTEGATLRTEVVKDFTAAGIWTGSLSFVSRSTHNVDGKLLFALGTSLKTPALDQGFEPWVSDGTEAGTHIIKDIFPGSGNGAQFGGSAVLGNKVFFSGNDGSSGSEIWMTDGTSEGTLRVADINPGAGAANLSGFVNYDGAIFFGADDGVVTGLWRTDGTTQGTELIKVVGETGMPVPIPSSVLGDVILFTAFENNVGWALWRSDGTTEGTNRVKDFQADASAPYSTPSAITVLNGRAYFSADDGFHGNELWISDGSTDGTLQLDLVPGPAKSNPSEFVAVDEVIYFSAGDRVWRTDGTANNTIPIKGDVNPRGNFVYKDGWIYFIGYSIRYGAELYRFMHEDIVTSIDETREPGVKVFPNPVTTTLNIVANSHNPIQVEVVGAQGQRIATLRLDAAADLAINMENYGPGLYLIRVIDGKREMVTKIIKK